MGKSLRHLRIILLLNLAVAVVLANLADVRTRGFAETTLTRTYRTLRGDFRGDSRGPMRQAWEYWSGGPNNRAIYSDLLITGKVRFQYPPATLLLPRWLSIHGVDEARFYAGTTYLFLILTVLAVAAIALHSLAVYGGEAALSRRQQGLLLAVIGLLTITFYPVVNAASVGQIQVWLTALFALSLLAHLNGRHTVAGILIGLMACVKPQYGLFVVWAALRGNRRFLVALLGTLIIGVTAGMATFGISTSVDYLSGLSFLARHGESYYQNQSFNGLVNRLFSVHQPHLYTNTQWRLHQFPPYNPWVYYSTILTSIAILAACLLDGHRRAAGARSADYCLMALGITMASPIAWAHHYGILLPVFALLWPLFWFGPAFAGARRSRLLLIACFLVLANFIAPANLLARTYLNFLQSYLFVAAMGVFAVLLRVRLQSERRLESACDR